MKIFLAITLLAVAASAAVMKPIGLTDEVQQIQDIINAINSPNTHPETAALLEQQLMDLMGMVDPVQPAPVIIQPQPVDIQPIQPVVIPSLPTFPSLQDLIGAILPPIVGAIRPPAPEIITFPVGADGAVQPDIAVGPEVIDFIPPAGALEDTINPAPAVVGPAPAGAASASPLVQIVVNVNAGVNHPNPVAVEQPIVPAAVVERPNPYPGPNPEPVNPIIPAPVIIEPVFPEVIPQPIVLPEAVLPEVQPTPVAIVEQPAPSPIQVAEPVLPIIVQPIVLPEELN